MKYQPLRAVPPETPSAVANNRLMSVRTSVRNYALLLNRDASAAIGVALTLMRCGSCTRRAILIGQIVVRTA